MKNLPLLVLTLLCFHVHAAEIAPTFAQVANGGVDGLAQEKSEFATQVRADAMAYANYRYAPQTDESQEVKRNCEGNAKSNLFCDVILDKPAPKDSPDSPALVRGVFFKALTSLDDPKLRAKKCVTAVRQLNSVLSNAQASSLHSRSLYWLWTCAKETKNDAEAIRLRDLMYKRFPVAFHTLEIMKSDHAEQLANYLTPGKDWPVAFRSRSQPDLNVWIAGIEALMENKKDGAAAIFGTNINAQLRNAEPELRLYVAVLMARVAGSIPSVLPVSRVLVPLFEDHPEYISRETLMMLYPGDYKYSGSSFLQLLQECKLDIDPFILAGLIHQESGLNPRAASRADAFGLTQMQLPTARDMYRRLLGDKTADVTGDMMREPFFAAKLGAADLRRRLNSFDDSEILALASYNAGEGRIKNWLKDLKPVLKTPQILADVILMNGDDESHTPQYVAAVLSKAFWYQELYPDLR